jgi:Ca2+-binding EF-hand superfamily protein
MLLLQLKPGLRLGMTRTRQRDQPKYISRAKDVQGLLLDDVKKQVESTQKSNRPSRTNAEKYVELILSRAHDGLDIEVKGAIQEFVQTIVAPLPSEQVHVTWSFFFELLQAGYAFRNAQYANEFRRMLKLETRSDKEYREAFDRIDVDHSGYIDRSEIKQVFHQVLGDDALNRNVDAFLHEFDTDGDMRISWEEFSDAKHANEIRHILRLWNRSDKELREAFEKIDVDNSGSIDRSEIELILRQVLGVDVEKNCDAFLQLFDTNMDENISWEEFSNALGVLPSSEPAEPPPEKSEMVDIAKASFLRWDRSDEEYREAFDRIDVDNSGTIDRSEIGHVFREVLGADLDTNVDEFLRRFDANRDESISWDEFLDALKVMRSTTPPSSPIATDASPPENSGMALDEDMEEYLEALREKARSLQAELRNVQKYKEMEQPQATTSLTEYVSSLSEPQQNILRCSVSEDVSDAMAQLVTSLFGNTYGEHDDGDSELTFTGEAFPDICFKFVKNGYQLRDMEAIGAAGEQEIF